LLELEAGEGEEEVLVEEEAVEEANLKRALASALLSSKLGAPSIYL
jgi:hypothetical protein